MVTSAPGPHTGAQGGQVLVGTAGCLVPAQFLPLLPLTHPAGRLAWGHFVSQVQRVSLRFHDNLFTRGYLRSCFHKEGSQPATLTCMFSASVTWHNFVAITSERVFARVPAKATSAVFFFLLRNQKSENRMTLPCLSEVSR